MRILIAIVAGILVGGFTNMGLILVGGELIAPPEGVDPTDIESVRASMHLYEPRHFLPPFLAHALGTLVGALVAARLAPTRGMALALGIGGFFLVGGIAASLMLPAPAWYIAVDLVAAYLPMAWIGGRLGAGRSTSPVAASS